jgi:hypothetical protein
VTDLIIFYFSDFLKLALYIHLMHDVLYIRREIYKTQDSSPASECSMLNVKCKNFHQMVFYSLIRHMPALITYVLQPLTLTS